MDKPNKLTFGITIIFLSDMNAEIQLCLKTQFHLSYLNDAKTAVWDE